ncbi:MAG: phosphatase PAP2 family protein [Longimicrobiales bacterium]
MGVTRRKRARASIVRPTDKRWMLARVSGSIFQHLLTGWDALPAANRQKWTRRIGAGAVALFGLMLALVALGKALVQNNLLSWEPDFLRALELRGPFGFSGAVWFQTFGTDITLAILILFTAGISAWKGRPLTALSIILAFLVIDIVVRFGWLTWDRSRPDLIARGVASPSFHSFPSGHTGKTLAVYGFLASRWWQASRNITERVFILVVTTFIIVIVPLGRLRMGVHWPSDILGGYTIGLAWTMLLIWAARLEQRSR